MFNMEINQKEIFKLNSSHRLLPGQ